MEEILNLSEWYTPAQAALVISKNSGRVVKAEYIRKIAEYGKIRKVKISNRANLYRKEDVDKYLVEDRGMKSGRAKKMKAKQKQEA